ncbi:interferon alpha/beta receptor 2-like [Chanos chanos]|uniref:Interferon alpha/beta receptor 2-like n=1 Tax=Chanos chanos TaxID=29144 RepID=A0A6J2WFB3_CHACN|nr:interferon alpha/beta receptor 2-like [Chanos chanos]
MINCILGHASLDRVGVATNMVKAQPRNLPSPVNMSIASHLFEHTLTWEAGPGSPDGLYYNVTVHPLNEASWVPVRGCERVYFPLLCNLTVAFSDLEESYFIRVTTSDGNDSSAPAELKQPFIPTRSTTWIAPLVKVTQCDQSLCVRLEAPSDRLKRLYNSSKYILNITRVGKPSVFLEEITGLKTVVLNLTPGEEYCVAVRIIDHNHAMSEPQCSRIVLTQPKSNIVIPVIVCVVILLFALIANFLVSSGRICLRLRLPDILSWQKTLTGYPLYWPSETSLSHVSIEKCTQEWNRETADDEGSEGEMEGEVLYERLAGRVKNLEDAPSSSSSSPFSCLSKYRASSPHSSGETTTAGQTQSPTLTQTGGGACDSFSQTQDPLFCDLKNCGPSAVKSGSLTLTSGVDTPDCLLSETNQLTAEGGICSHRISLSELRTLDTSAQETTETNEEEMEVERESDVNLLSVTFGWREEVEEEQSESERRGGEEDRYDEEVSDMKNLLFCRRSLEPSVSFLPSPTQSGDAQPVVTHSLKYSSVEEEEEEEEEEFSGYMSRN